MLTNTSVSLLDRLKATGTPNDWDLFVQVYQPFIVKHIVRSGIPECDADDLYQETLTQVLTGITRFDHNGNAGAFRNWLKKIINQRMWHYAKSQCQTHKLNQHYVQIQSAQVNRHAIDELWDREHDRYVVNRLLELIRKEFTATSWEAFRRVVLDGQSVDIVAQQLSVTINSILIAKSRIMKRLRTISAGLIDSLGS